uniref:Uncharacterized protein n=1 Tax=Romanomermis culicivorax TaxID=13658 RepID=A0A915KF49_ROMCU
MSAPLVVQFVDLHGDFLTQLTINRVPNKSNAQKIMIDHRHLQKNIKNSTPEDQAIYKCEARNEVGEDSISYNVQVIQTPKIGSGASVQVIEGQNALLSCDVSAFPPPQVIWQRNGQRVNTGGRYVVQNNNLRISTTRSVDAGMYVCVATNDAGTAQQAYTLDVLIAPKMLTSDAEAIFVPLGETFELKCKVSGHPEPSTTWHKEMQSIKADLHTTIAANGSLIVRNAAMSDAGNYKCVRTNAAGTAVKSYTIQIIKPPRLSDESMKIINVTESNPVLLACRFEAEDGAKVFWHKDEVPLASYYNPRIAVVNLDLHLVINDTRLVDTGVYKCSAVNPAGNVTQIFQLNVGVPPKITPEPRRVVVLNGSDAELPCEAIGHPKPCVTWMQGSEVIPETHQKGTSLFFARARPENASVYTCKAHNWAGEAYHDVELAVHVAPTVIPERFNVTERENVSITLECKATGIPEPTIAWFKEPKNEPIVSDNKYAISTENSLTVRNLKKFDDGFYRCVASNDAGVAIGHRRLHIAQPDWRILFVECDKNGRPIRMTYVPARGDIPSDYHKLLPWSAEDQDLPENGTANTLIKCLPTRDNRRQRNHLNAIATIPKLAKLPENQVVQIGDTVTLTCEGVGNPSPEILWTLNGRPIDDNPVTVDGRSVLTINDVQKSAAGRYMCIARNHKGSTRAVAVLRVNEAPQKVAFLRANGQKPLRYSQTVSILTCKIPSNLNNGKVFWMKNGRMVRPDRDRVTILKNGTLILNNVDDNEAREYQCVIDKKHVATRLMEKTVIEHDSNRESIPHVLQIKIGKPVWLNCYAFPDDNQPIHHRSLWFHNDKPLDENSWRISIMYNQSLWIKYAYDADLGEYKCVAFDHFGRIAGITKYVLEKMPVEMTAHVQGTINGFRLKDASMLGTVASKNGKGEVEIRLENLPLNMSTKQDQTLLSSAIAPCWLSPFVNIKTTGHHGRTNAEQFESRTEYRFSTGDTLKLEQRGKLANSKGYVVMDLAVDGSVPHLSENSVVIMEPYVEHLVRSGTDRMQGYGTGAYR